MRSARGTSGSNVIAVIFDFDDTLLPDSTTQFLKKYGVDAERFWKKDARALIEQGFDPALAYLNLILENVGAGKALGDLTTVHLRRFGATLDFHPGLPGLFQDLRQIGRRRGIDTVEFYVISGGLYDVIAGAPLMRKNMTAIYASHLSGEGGKGVLRYIKRCVTFTEKTRFLFEINKGLSAEDTLRNPYLVNKSVSSEVRRVPFENMIFVGDGMTDVPCLSLVQSQGGLGFGVFNPAERKSAKRALLEFLGPRRVISMHAPRYGATDELGSLLRSAVEHLCVRSEPK